MAFPKTLDELVTAGYQFDNHATCRGCGADIEWWIAPSRHKIPMNPMERGTASAISHFVTCPDASLFRNKSARGTK